MTITTLLDQLEAGTAYAQLPMNEQIAMRAIARRLIAMSEKGVTPEDWQQLAGYAEWAIAPKRHNAPVPSRLSDATVAGQWIPWRGGSCPVDASVIIEAETRGGVRHRARAGGWRWEHKHNVNDIVAYRLAD